MRVRKVAGQKNPADLMTKHLAFADMMKHLTKLGFSPETGRSEAVSRIQIEVKVVAL